MSKCESVSGNAILTSPMENKQGKFWKCNYHIKDGESFESVIEVLKTTLIPECSEYVFGEEFGNSGKTPHIEGGFITRTDRTRWTSIQAKFKFSDLQKSRPKNWKALCTYCTKECNRIVCSKGVTRPPRTHTREEIEARPWQKEMLAILEQECEWNCRTIYWRWGEVNIGKTQFSKYLCAKHAAVVLEGSKKHMLAQVQNQPAPIYIVLLAYGDEMVSYRAIEQIKDGLFSSSFGCDNNHMEIRDAPHILIIGNEPPDTSCPNFHPTKYNVKQIENGPVAL